MTAVQTMSPTRTRGSKKGFTLTEIAIVLGIIGLILGAVWAAASGVYANLKANQGQQGILAAAQAVRSMFATSANTSAAGTVITSPGMFPVSWQSSTLGVVGNPWHLNPGAAKNYAFVIGSGQQFAVEIDGISDAGCATLSGFYNQAASSQSGGAIPGLVGSANSITASPGFQGGVVGAIVVAGYTFPTSAAPGPYAAPANCKGGALNDNFAVFFDMAIM